MGRYLGIDLGTQACRVMVVSEDGEVISHSVEALRAAVPNLLPGWSEQDPRTWWGSVRRATREAMGKAPGRIDGVCVDSTSGTVLAIDRGGNPLTNALMYNDGRAVVESRLLSEAGRELEGRLGYRVKPSFGIAKLLWLKRNKERVFESAYRFIHAADHISGRLVGHWSHTDHTNALKSCFDLLDYGWPDFLGDLGIPLEKLPTVVPPGTEVGTVTPRSSKETGIPEGTPVLAGLTDGCASQIASGAAAPGDWESTLGTTLVVKGVTRELLKDSLGRIYSHLHPQGFWMPGGASSTGGECLFSRFPGANLSLMDRKALKVAPTRLIVYPLVRRGERFPFVDPRAEGFELGTPSSQVELYASYLEGVAFVERMAYEVLEALGAEVGGTIFTAGGGSRSREWLQIRANVLGRTILRTKVPEAAMGSAILAGSARRGEPLGDMARRMVEVDLVVEPDEEALSLYDRSYGRFRAEVERRFDQAG